MKQTDLAGDFKGHQFIEDLFPFYLIIDREMTILSRGKSMDKLGLVDLNTPFLNTFKVERPLQTNTFEDMKRQKESLFILSMYKEIDFKFRGQMYYDELNDRLFFLGSPLIKSFDDLKEVDLSLNDFALHDNINQFLFTTQMLLSSLKDAKGIEKKLKKTNEEITQKNDELQNYTYILSHDLKSPIRGILSMAEFMEEDLKNNKLDELPSYIHTIKERVVRMHNLIDGILDFSEIGILDAKKENIDLNELIHHVFEDIFTEQDVVYNIENLLPIVHNVRLLIFQLFSNIISNAIKHNDKKQVIITIDYKDMKDNHEFVICDNGPGIPKSYHEKIFEIFQTLQPKNKFQSTGVGLSIVKKIITSLNGSVWVESKINEGTSFYIRIPKD